jgi:hypothetical protein
MLFQMLDINDYAIGNVISSLLEHDQMAETRGESFYAILFVLVPVLVLHAY